MVEVSFVGPGYSLPEPASDAARFFHSSTRDEFLRQLEDHSKRRKRRLFVATSQGRMVACGLTRIYKVLSSDGEVLLSESTARHRVNPNVPPLAAGHWYEMAIDPSSSDILTAKKETPQDVTAGPTSKYPIDLRDLPLVSRSEAGVFFNDVRRQPHIPFLYSLDGCWARAHEMARLIERYFDPNPRTVVAKIWNFGANLSIETDTNPDCKAEWYYHVAPVVKTKTKLLVIDPALFEQPVSVDVWRSRQSDPSAEVLFTSREAYTPTDESVKSIVQPAFSAEKVLFVGEQEGQTEEALQECRGSLNSMIYGKGPIPYRCGC